MIEGTVVLSAVTRSRKDRSMSVLLHDRRRWVIVVLAVALSAAVFSMGRVSAADADGAVDGDGLYNEGLVCFDVGQRVSSITVGGPGGFDVTASTLGFATLQGFGGSDVFVRNVALAPGTDQVKVILSKSARRHVCAAWHIVNLEFAG
jgi:hypothetical protein